MKHLKEWIAVTVAVLGFLGYLIRPAIQYGIEKNKFDGLVSKAEAAEKQMVLIKVDNETAIAAIKPIIYGAKNTAEDALNLGQDLKVQIADVRGAQETFRKEYREDQKDLDRKLENLLNEVKKDG